MPHVFEAAASGRSKCRGCGRVLQKGELRFGERMANPFAEGTELSLWFHPSCAAYKRPEALLEALARPVEIPDRESLERVARASLERPRLPRIDGAERAKGQATCRQCREPIPRGALRIRLVLFEEGQFSPGGFIHIDCARAYFEASDIVEHVLHFSRDLGADDRGELADALASSGR